MPFVSTASTNARNNDIVIKGNTLTDQYYYGIYVYYANNVEISDNELSDFRSAYAYGIYPYHVDGCQIIGNHMSMCTMEFMVTTCQAQV